MDIQQQTKNVAAQGRFGDSMLLHVNPAEVKGLASAVPLTVNPETGQPEAFLPFLAPILGSMGITALAGTGVGAALGLSGLSAGALAGLGAGLATYAETGGSGSKALLSGLTAGLGTRALQGAAQGTQAGVDAAISTPPVDPSFVGPMPTPVTPPVAPPIDRSITAGESLKSMFTQPDVAGQVGGFDAGMKSLAGAAMSPSGMAAGTAAGTAGVIQSQEEFERQMAQMGLDEEERKRKMYEMYPEQIPMASGGRTGFYHGGTHNPRIDAQRAANNIVFDVPDTNYSNINYGLDGIGGGFNAYSTPARRTTRPIGRGFMPGFMPEYSYFEGMNPSATALGYDPLGNFQNPQLVNQTANFGGPSQLSRERGGFGGLFGRSRGLQPLSPPGGFRNEGGYGYTPPPPQFAGYGNPFMQSPSYQGFYGVPQMQQTLNPYARFTQQPMPYQPYVPYQPPVDTPPDDGGTPPDDGGGTGGGGTPPIDPPIDDGGGRKGAVRNVPPTAPVDDFTNPGAVGRPAEPPIDGFKTLPYEPPVSTPPVNTPPPTVTIPIEGGADVTIPDYSRPQPPRLEPPISIDRIGNYDLDRRFGAELVNAQPAFPVQSVTTPQNIGNNPPPMSIGGPGGGRGDIFGAPMFAAGGDTDLPNEGLEALSKTEKGREAIEAMGYQEGGATDMMQDPITQDVIMFILGETDNENAINAFVEKYGAEQFMFLRDKILKQAAGNPDAQTEGLIQGQGNSGMADDLPMNIGDKPIAAVSQDEYIIPADVVSMLGDGSSDAGSKQLDGMLDRVRQAKTGGKTQAPPLNPQKGNASMNQVAEKIEVEAEEGFEISLMPSDKMTLVWEQCEKFLEKSCKRSNGRSTPKDVFYDCLNNRASLWIIFDKGSLDIVGCAITKINQYPTGKKMLNIDHVTGKKMNDWADRGLKVIYKWAKANDCKGIEGVGREGFWNWIKAKEDWKKTAVFFEYEFEDNE